MENAKTVPLHFTPELEGLKDQGSLSGRKTYIKSDITMGIVSWYAGFHASLAPRGGSNTKLGDHDTSNLIIDLDLV